jgi:hypothetical protein
MIRYRDFAPQRIKGGLLRADRYETFDQAVTAATAWLAESHIEPITMETVVMPNIWSSDEEGTKDGSVDTSESMTSVNSWYQFLRVWYRD